MEDDTVSIVPFRGGALERAAWGRLRDLAGNQVAGMAIGAQRRDYLQRLDSEHKALGELGIEPGVLLEVSWVIRDLRSRGVVFGLGYGPQCASLLLYLLGIHAIDPLQYGLPFTGFGSELEEQRLHLRVSTRAEQAETTSMLRHYARISLHEQVDEKAVYVVVGREQAPGFTHEMMRMLAVLEGRSGYDPSPRLDKCNDKKTFDLIERGDTSGIHLLDDPQIVDCLRTKRPHDMCELVRIAAVCRHGVSNELKSAYFSACDDGQPTALPHAGLEAIIAPTGYVWLFYEQIVDAFRHLTQWSWASSLELCRQLRLSSEVPRAGEISAEAAQAISLAWGVPESRGIYLLRMLHQTMAQTIERAALLPEVLEAYRQAYFKARYPAIFRAAQMNIMLARLGSREGVRYARSAANSSGSEQRDALIDLCRSAVHDGIALLPPDINRSDWGFKAIERDRILFGLGAIACIDRNTARRIVAGRQSGLYTSLMDLITKAYRGELDYQRIEPLILSGAMDVFRRPRSKLLYELDAIFGNAPARMQISMDEQFNESSPGQAPSRNSWAGARSEESWAFQAELDVLGCVPSSLYYPEKGGSSLIFACS